MNIKGRVNFLITVDVIFTTRVTIKTNPHPKNKVDNGIVDIGTKCHCLNHNRPSRNDRFEPIGDYSIKSDCKELHSMVSCDLKIKYLPEIVRVSHKFENNK